MEYHEQNYPFVFSFILQCCIKSRLHSGSDSLLLLQCNVYIVDVCAFMCVLALQC